jgi:hypothetical protein
MAKQERGPTTQEIFDIIVKDPELQEILHKAWAWRGWARPDPMHDGTVNCIKEFADKMWEKYDIDLEEYT